MELFLFIIAVMGWAYGFWQHAKSKEFERLFELSKLYSPDAWSDDGSDLEYVSRTVRFTPKPLVKLNKDGSIAKKRGRPIGSKKK